MELLDGQKTPQAEGVVSELREHIRPTGEAPKGKEASGLWKAGALQPCVVNLPQLLRPVHLSWLLFTSIFKYSCWAVLFLK